MLDTKHALNMEQLLTWVVPPPAHARPWSTPASGGQNAFLPQSGSVVSPAGGDGAKRRGWWPFENLLTIQIIAYAALFFNASYVDAQFAPAAGLPGTTAIFKDSSAFVAWATGCAVQRGWQNIADTTLGLASVGDSSAAIGTAGLNGVISLGDGGSATLNFAQAIYNGPGFDMAVFENGFATSGGKAFLEFAFVEVSSDGQRFVRFPATSNIEDSVQMAMAGTDCSLVNNLAGKYVYGYGTPFDLDELKDSAGLDVDHITHVRVVDVVGSIDPAYATYDKNGRAINDPWPTAFASSGFDLDAVGVIHAQGITNDVAEIADNAAALLVFPNPCAAGAACTIKYDQQAKAYMEVFDVTGKKMLSRPFSGDQQLATTNWPRGIYFVNINSSTSSINTKLVIE